MQESFKISVKGNVNIYLDDQLILDHHNDVQTTAKDIIRRSLSSPSHLINKIIIFNNSNELAEVFINPSFIGYIGTNIVSFRFIVPQESFEGDFNKLHLVSDNPLGKTIFSIINFDTLSKTLENSLVIDWLLTVELI